MSWTDDDEKAYRTSEDMVGRFPSAEGRKRACRPSWQGRPRAGLLLVAHLAYLVERWSAC
jgi:hypothetical protein